MFADKAALSSSSASLQQGLARERVYPALRTEPFCPLRFREPVLLSPGTWLLRGTTRLPWSGPLPACSPSRGGSGGSRRGQGLGWRYKPGPSKCGEHFPKASGARRVLRSGDYRSDLQKHVTNLGQRWRGELDEQAQRGRAGSPGAVPERSREPWRSRLSCGLPGGLPSRRRGCPCRWGASASQPAARVCSVRWKPPHSNPRGPIRAWRARPFKRAWVQPQPGLRLPPRRHRRRGGR